MLTVFSAQQKNKMSCTNSAHLKIAVESLWYKFLSDNGIRVRKWDSVFSPSVYTDTIKNSVRLIRGKDSPSLTPQDGKYRLPYCDHAIIPHLRSENLRVMEMYEKEILASLSRFRESRNLTWLIYPLHLSREGRHGGSQFNPGCRILGRAKRQSRAQNAE